MTLRKVIGMMCLLALSCTAGYAQKYGHLNLGNAVAMMPETKTADAELAAYQTQLIAKGEAMAKKFQENYEKFVKDSQSGTFPPVQLRTRQEELQKERDALVDYQDEVEELVQKKREELLKPIFDKVMAAVKDIAKENGYLLVFDSSVFNTLLFAEDQDDLMPLLKAKLGIK